MNKAKNRDAGQPHSESRPAETETLELSPDQTIEGGPGTKPRKESPVKLKPAQQTSNSPQKSTFASQIGQSLQNAYNDILQQPVPDRFLELLRQLESGQTKTLPESKKDHK